jgi:hypothetical protein
MKNTLTLALKKLPFDVMVTGEKSREYRKPSKWIKSRLYKHGAKREYEFIKFVNGYGAHRPYFVCEFLYFFKSSEIENIQFSNGLVVDVERGDFVIALGEIIEKSDKVKCKDLRIF